MGLKQTFKFEYLDLNELIDFVESFSKEYEVQNLNNDLLIIKSSGKVTFNFDLVIESYGLNTERSGDYFKFLGIFIEALTGKFGKVEIDDI